MRAEQRAENPVISTESTKGRPNGISILPRELRVSVLAARLFLGSLTLAAGGFVAQEAFKAFTGNTSIAEAASCLVEPRITTVNAQKTPIAGANISYRTDNKEVASATTNREGKATTRITSECVTLPDGRQGLKITVRVIAPDGRIIQEDVSIPDRGWKEWVATFSELQPTRIPVPPTETPKPVATNTPTPASTSEALARRVEENKKQLEEEQKIVIAKGTATALAEQIEAARGTPSRTPTPTINEVLRTQIVQAQVTATQEKELAGLRRTATALAEQISAIQGTPTALTEVQPSPTIKPEPLPTPFPTRTPEFVVGPVATVNAQATRNMGTAFSDVQATVVAARATATQVAKKLEAAELAAGAAKPIETPLSAQTQLVDLRSLPVIGGAVLLGLAVLDGILFPVRRTVARSRYNRAVTAAAVAGGPPTPGPWHRPSIWKVWQWKSQ